MLKTVIMLVVCQLGLLSVSGNDQHDSGFLLLQCDSRCTLPEFPGNGRYTVLGAPADTHPGAVVPNSTVIQYNCDVGYVPYSHSTAVCIDGTWDTQFTKCQRKVTCHLPTNPAHGSFVLSGSGCPLVQDGEVLNWTAVIYSCDATYDIVGNRAAVCQNGLWTTGPPQCQKSKNCILPDLPKIGSYSIVGCTKDPKPGVAIAEKEALRYNCTPKNGGPTDQVIVCSNGNWLPGVVECVPPSSCADVLGSTSGVYVIQPTKTSEPFEVYCDLTLTGQKWTVIQKRFSKDVNFNRSYKECSVGFGSKTGNHWLGLEHIHEITKEGHHELYVELQAHNGTKKYARYNTFIVGSSSTGFKLTISGYSGNAGDSMYDTGSAKWNLNGMKFSTFDKDQDGHATMHCAKERNGAWWFNGCSNSDLNGVYHDKAVSARDTMHWHNYFGDYALKTSRMLVRRK